MIKQFINQIKQYFGFSNSEAGGFIVLIFLLLAFISLPLLYRILVDNNDNIAETSQQKLDSLKKELSARIDLSNDDGNKFEGKSYDHNYDAFSTEKNDTKAIKMFEFDPNILNKQGFIKLGMPGFIAERILKYRAAGGKFKTKEDLQKIYGLLPTTYSKLAPYIDIRDEEYSLKKYPNVTKTENNDPTLNKIESNPFNNSIKKPIIFDLNKADTSALMQIKGVGSKLSQRIIKFRDNLGGFYSENQVKEVFGLDSLVVSEILKYGSIKTPIYKKIEINDAIEIKHPYLKPYIAKAIIAYRNQHGKFASLSDLKNVKLLGEQTIDKLKPYLKF